MRNDIMKALAKSAIDALLVVAVGSILVAVGCAAHKIQVINNTNVVTNTLQTTSFQDEQYIWESWTISTNAAAVK